MALNRAVTETGFIESIPSVPIHSSLLVALAAGLFLGALLLRAHRLSQRPAPAAGLSTSRAARARSIVHQRLSQAQARQRASTPMITSVEEAPEMKPAHPQPFRIRWGATAVALLGVLGLLTGVVTAVLAGFGLMGWTVPGIAGAVLVISLSGLQISAALRRRTRRRARVENALREAMNPPAQLSSPSPARVLEEPASSGEDEASEEVSPPFDALRPDAAGSGGPDSLLSLDQDGLPESAERLLAQMQISETQVQSAVTWRGELFDQSSASSQGEWDRREVPRPKYLTQERAQPAAAEPLREPEQPMPSPETKLKQPAAPAASSSSPDHDQQRDSSINLGEVLKRRRA